jgi:hypothetical protein
VTASQYSEAVPADGHVRFAELPERAVLLNARGLVIELLTGAAPA